MRLHRLEITGIGPFPGTEKVDFDRLDESGVFLLTGHTGAGKTTVLDAVSYAIFGTIPRSSNKRPASSDDMNDDVVSHHRDLDTTPRVVLEATIGDVRLRIDRSPRHERPVKRGSGTTSQEQALQVERRDGGNWVPVPGKRSEVDTWLEDRIGMNAGQFSQVVMLPQGQFSEFLEASAGDRRAVLQRLFPDTDLTWLEDWLKQQAEQAASERNEMLNRIRGCFLAARSTVRTLHEGDVEDDDLLPDHQDQAAALAFIDDTGRQFETIADDRERERVAAHDAWEAATVELQRLERQAKLVEDRRKADREMADLVSRKEWREQTGERIAAARRAAPVVALASAAATRRRERDEAVAELDRLRPLVSESRLVIGTAEADYETLRDQLRETARTVHDFLWKELAGRPDLEKTLAAREAELEELAAAGPESAVGQARARVEKREAESRAAKQLWLDIRTRRTEGLKAELAGDLKDGEPCPVCGSTEHPAPATTDEAVPTAGEEDEAEAAFERADLAESEAREAEAAASKVAAAARAKAETEKARLEKELEQLAARERELRGEHPNLEDRHEELAGTVKLLDQFLAAAAAAKTKAEASERAETEAATEATARDFESIEAAGRAALAAPELARMETETGAWDKRHTVVSNALAGELAKVDPAATVEPGPAREAEVASSKLRDGATTAADRAAERLRVFREETGPVPELYRELEPLREQVALTAELNRLASGKNERRMALSIFMLATRLQQVIVAANRHLSAMSDQRYTLVYTPELAGHGAASGLGIEVHDSHTARTRPTRTLSGGEKFQAALSLALGLAEIVQAESAGKSLGSLFIDEGFGTLDTESLEKVMVVIDSLREGGRTVGVVSHVDELRNRLPAQIRVHGSQDGSTLEVVTG